MKKVFLSSLVLLLFSASIVIFQMSCKKSAVAQAPQNSITSIEGLWIGTNTVNGQSVNRYYSFVIKPDGTMLTDSKDGTQQHLNIGTWTLVGDSLSCTTNCVYGYPASIGVVLKNKAYFNATAGTLTGLWNNVSPQTGSGTFTMTKVE